MYNILEIIEPIYFFFSKVFVPPLIFLLIAILQYENKRLFEVMSAHLTYADETQKQSS